MRLKWTCQLGVGPYRWRNTEVYEPDECGCVFYTDADVEYTQCPSCGGELSDDYDFPELVED